MEQTDHTFLMKPKIDFCFKELMQNPDVRKGFLAALLQLTPDEIRETKLLPTHLRKERKEENRPCLYTDKLEVHVLELPKLKKHQYPETTLLKWARFINAEKKEELEKMAKTDEYIEKAYDQLVHLSADQMKKLEYEEREKAIRDYNHQVKCYWEDGMETGRKQGISQGEEKLGKLISLLISKNRIDEIEQVSGDKEYRDQLYKEFGL